MLDNAKTYASVIRLFKYIDLKLNVNAREKIAKINCKTCKNSLKNVKKLVKKKVGKMSQLM